MATHDQNRVVEEFRGQSLKFRGQEDVKKLNYKCGATSALKKVAPGCPMNDRWGIGIHFASNRKPRKFC